MTIASYLNDPVIFKICEGDDWLTALPTGSYLGSTDDRRDGFIHFSAAEHVPGTLARYFVGRSGLVLIAVSVAALGPALRWEASRGGSLFPHLYADLPLAAVIGSWPITVAADGTHVLPDLSVVLTQTT